jgi:hypothetical protein
MTRNDSNQLLRRLLSQPGSYQRIAAAVAAGELAHFRVALFDHIGDVYRRVEIAAGGDADEIDALRLTALVHEQPPASVPQLLGSAGLSDFVPSVLAVTGAFGCVWKMTTDDDLRCYVDAHRTCLGSILLFELAHEGRATPTMHRAAELGRLQSAFARWAQRLIAVRGHQNAASLTG